MTYQPPNDGNTAWQGQPVPPPLYPQTPPPPPGRRKLGAWAITGIVVGALVLVCCGIGTVAALVGGKPEATRSPTAAAVDRAVPATPTPAEPTSSPSPTTAASTTAAPPPPATTTAPVSPPAPAKITMPDVTGTNAAIADQKLQDAGFTNVQFGSADSDDKVVLFLPNWTVTKQSAKPGAKLAADDLIVLTCTKG